MNRVKRKQRNRKEIQLSLLCMMVFICFMLEGCNIIDSEIGAKKGVGQQGVHEENEQEESTDDIVTLEFYTWEDEQEYMEEMIARYMETHENIVIHMNILPVLEYAQALEIALNTEKQVDVFASSKPSIGAIQIEKGYALDMSSYVKESQMRLDGYGEWFEDLLVNDRVYMLPYRMSSWVVFYNKAIFDEAGIPYPEEGWTWDDYTEIAKKLTSNTNGTQIYGSMSHDLSNMWWRTPARTIGKDIPLDEEGMEALKKSAEWSYDMAYKYKVQQPFTEVNSTDGFDYSRTFAEGKIGMFFNGEWCLPILNEMIEEGTYSLEYDVAPLPIWEGEENYSIATAAVMQIAEESKYPKEAFEFVSFVCGSQGGKILAEQSLLPAWNSKEIRDTFQDSLPMPEHSEYFFSDKKMSYIFPDKNYEESMMVVKKYVNQYLLKELTLEQAFENIETELREKGLKP